MTFGRMLLLTGVALLVLITNVIASILYMVAYGHIIDPGHPAKYYQDHIQIAGPYCSIVAGIPIMFCAGWWVAGLWNRSLQYRGAIAVWIAYTVIDLAILIMSGLSLGIGVLFVISFATKLAAVYYGARVRLRARPDKHDSSQAISG